jgi:hypothetical protein
MSPATSHDMLVANPPPMMKRRPRNREPGMNNVNNDDIRAQYAWLVPCARVGSTPIILPRLRLAPSLVTMKS